MSISVVVCAVLLPSRPASAPSTFVDRALGAPSPDASLERRLATGATLAVDGRGVAARVGSATIGLASSGAGHGAWQRYGGGVTRATSFGRESILFGINRAEQFLTVARRQGTRTWRWQLDATHGVPHLDAGGGVSFAGAGSLAGLRILPVAILDRSGRDVTPAGLRWSLDRQGSGWVLGVRLDDRRLPVPYLIDPILLIPACDGTTGCTTATSTGSSSLGIARPSAAVAGDVMVAQLTVGSTGAIAPPAGWSQIGATAQDAAGPIEQAVFWHRVDVSDPGPFTFSWAGGNADASGGIVTYQGVDPFLGVDQGGSAVKSMNSGGTAATGNAAGLTVTTLAAQEMLQAAYGVANGVTVTQTSGLTSEWTVSSAGGTKVTAAFADLIQPAAGTSGNKTATWGTSSLWVAHLFALKNEAGDGTGTMVASPSTVSASQTGLTQTLTYTPAAGSMANGDVTFVVPAGWTAPQATMPTAAGYVTATGGSGTNTISVVGQTVTVSGVTLNQGVPQTLVMKYGDTSGGGPGATATATTGAATWTTKERSSSRGTLSLVVGSPSITVFAADGAGTAAPNPLVVSAAQVVTNEKITFTTPAGGMSNGTLTLDVPAGWTPPSTTSGTAGFTSATPGVVSVAGQRITVTGLTRAALQTVVITYGSTTGGGSGSTAPAATGSQTWQVQEASTVGGVLTPIASSPVIPVRASDGSGTLTTATSNVSASQSGDTVAFTYTAAAGGTTAGTVTLVVPAGWSAPSTSSAAAGYTTSSAGSVGVAGQTITVSSLTLAAGATATITYGSTAGSGSGATATATTGAQTWQAQERSTTASGGALTNLGVSPAITINAANGSGTMTLLPANTGNGSSANTLTFTYTAAAGGMTGGAVTVAAPAGWSAPSTTATDPGYTTASTGTVSVAGQTITVGGVTLAGAATLTVVYGDTGGSGPGATASTTAGTNVFQAQQRSTVGGVLTNLAASPSLNVYAADGSGTMTTPTANVVNGSTNTAVFTYTAAAGGTSNGTVTLTVPAGWPAPTAGNTTSSLGATSYAGQAVTVSSLTLAATATFTITYGSAAAPTTGGLQTWSTSEASTAGGTLTGLAAPPSVNVYAPDGSGTLTGAPATVGYGSIGNTETFTYTAAAGGMSVGSVTVVVPAGWSAPSTVSGNAGYTVASTGTVAVAGQTITVSSVTLAGGATLTITYGSGVPGATAPAAAGAATWQVQSNATLGGVLTNLAASPSVTVAPEPVSTVTFPAASGLFGTASWTAGCAGVGFCGTATDNSGTGIQRVELTIRQGAGNYWNGSAFSSASPVFVLATGGSSWSYAFPASSFPADGSYTVQTRAMDNRNGVETPSSTTFTVDQTPPSAFSLGAPSAGQAIRNGQAVSVPGGWPTDANGVAGVVFKACAGAGACTFAGATVTVGSSSVSPYSVTWGSQPADGPYKVVARATDNAGNTTDSAAVGVTVDNTAPVNALAMASGSGAYLAGGTVYFKGDAAGSFVLHDALTDATSGPASVDYPDVATGGWTHASESTSTGPGFASSAFSWTASPSLPSGYVVTGHDLAGNTATQPVAFVDDTTAPAGGSVSYAGGYYSAASVPVTLGDGIDSQSGIDTTSAGSELLQRSSATLASGACGSFGGFTTIAIHPGVAYTDTSVSSGACYRYRYVVLDNVGNSVTYASGATVGVDTVAPNAFSLSAPAVGFVGPSVTVSATAADTGGSGIAQLEFRYCAGASCSFAAGTTIGSPVATSGSASQAWDLSGLTDGAQYTVVARATDAAGNTTDSATTTVTLDMTPPATSDDAPAGSRSSTVTVTLSPGDGSGSGVASTSYRVDGGGWQSGTSVVIPAPADHSNDGAHTIDYYSVDNVGNTETVRHASVTIDTQPPSGAPVDPGSTLRGTVSLSDASPTDPGAGVASVAFQYSPHGAGTWTTIGTATSAPWAALFDTTAVADGQYDLREVISDAAVPANVATVALTGPKVIDNTPPSSAAVTAPAPGAYVGGTVTLGGSASDASSGVDQMVFKVNGTVVGTTSGTPASVSWDSTSTPDGPVSVTVAATDVAGNGPTVSSSRTIVVDNHPPTVTLADPGAAVRGTATLTTTTSSDTTQVTFERSPAGAGTWTTIAVDNTPPFGASLDTTLLADGLYDLHAVATDGAHLVTSNVVTTRVDNAAPSGSVTAPVAGATVGGPSVTLRANAADGGSGVATVQFRVDGTAVGTVSSAPWTLAWNPSSTPSGAHTIDAVVTDAAGNAFTTAGVTVTVDSTPPSVTLTDPGTLLAGVVTLHATSPDADTVRVDFQISPAGAGAWTTVATDTTPPYSGVFDTTTLADGLYDFRAIARDAAGNLSTPSVVAARRIDNFAPSVISATAADGLTFAVTANGALSAVTGPTLDGVATPAPTISGPTATFATGPLADGPHTFAGTLVDLVGKTTPFTIHFTVDHTPPPAPVIPSQAVVYVDAPPQLGAIVLEPAGQGDVVRILVELCADPACISVVTTGYTGFGSVDTPRGWQAPSLPDGVYFWRALAEDVAGNQSPWSAVGSFVVDTVPPAVPALGGPAVGAIVDTARLTGVPGTSASGIAFQVCADAACANVLAGGYAVTPASGAAPSWTPTGLADGTYFWRIDAHDEAGNASGWSETKSFVLDQTPPGTPRSLRATVMGRTLMLRWQAPALTHHLVGYTLLVNGKRMRTLTLKTHTVRIQLRKRETRLFAVASVDAAGNVSRPTRQVAADSLRLANRMARGAAAPQPRRR